MAVTILSESESVDYQKLLTGTRDFIPASALVSSKSYQTVKEALEDPITKENMLDVWKQLINHIQAGHYVGTDEAAQGIVSAIMEHPKIILEHEDFKDVKLIPYFKEVQAYKLPFPKMVIVLGSPFNVSQLIAKSNISKEKHDDGKGNLTLFWCVYAAQHDEQVLLYVPLMDVDTKVLHILELGISYGETATGTPKMATWVHPQQHTWTTVDKMGYFLRFLSEAVFMMTLNPSESQGCASIPTEKEIAINKKRLRKNKKPLIEFKLITIDGKKKDALPSIPVGSHASPRQHWRRGHWRHYSSGKNVFIEPMLVGDEKNGKIIKDYAVGKYEDRGHERGGAHPA